MLYSGVLQRLSTAAMLIIEETGVRWRALYIFVLFSCVGTLLVLDFENTHYATLSHQAQYTLLVAVYYMTLLFYIYSFHATTPTTFPI